MNQKRKIDGNRPDGRPGLRSLPIALAALAAFAVFIYIILTNCHSDYLREVAETSFFIPGSSYFGECMRSPGGLVVWLSTFFTSAFAAVKLGAAVYAILAFVFTLLAVKAFRMPWAVAPAAVLPVGAAAVSLLSMGYMIFSLKSPGWAFSPLVGLVLVALICLAYSRLPWWWARAALMVAIVVAGYPYLGFYALLAASAAVAGDLGEMLAGLLPGRSHRWLLAVPVAVGVLGVWLVPDIYFTHFSNDLADGRQWLAPLPWFMESEGAMWLPYKVISAAVCLMPLLGAFMPASLCRPKMRLTASSVIAVVCGMAVYGASVAWILAGRYSDANFNLTLALDRTIDNGDTSVATEWWTSMEEEPTRLNVVLTHAALMSDGSAPDMIFRVPNGNAPYATTDERAVRLLHEVGAPVMYYNLGFNRYAYRMAMEDMVEYGRSVRILKLLAKNAIANCEQELARKYLSTLAQVPFCKDWADKYLAYIDNTGADESVVAEMNRLAALKITQGSLLNDAGRLETLVWPYVSHTETDNATSLDRAIIGAMMDQNLDLAKQLIDKYILTHGRQTRLPLHYQECILAYSLANNNDEYRLYAIDQPVLDRYNAFSHLLNTSGGMSEDVLFRNVVLSYGDTYWFYYMYKPRLGII